MKRAVRIIALLAMVFSIQASYVFAIPYAFQNITQNSAIDAAIGEAQLKMDVSSEGGGQVLFTFSNTGPYASSVTDIYFEDNVPLLIFDHFVQVAGVSFAVGANPPSLPGGENYSFTANHAYDSIPPAQPNGVNPGETLGILFDLSSSYTFAEIISALEQESLRVGIHVQGFDGDGSESFINGGTPVPEPSTALLVGAGLAGALLLRNRRKSR